MTYTVHAKRAGKWWELRIADVGVTQARTLAAAEDEVRDYLVTYGIPESGIEIELKAELGGIEDEVAAVRQKQERVEVERAEAAKEVRRVAKELRQRGLSVSDVAAVLHVSRGRVSQLVG